MSDLVFFENENDVYLLGYKNNFLENLSRWEMEAYESERQWGENCGDENGQ